MFSVVMVQQSGDKMGQAGLCGLSSPGTESMSLLSQSSMNSDNSSEVQVIICFINNIFNNIIYQSKLIFFVHLDME